LVQTHEKRINKAKSLGHTLQVIVAIAYYVVALNLITIEKFLLIVLTSFPIIVALLYPVSKVDVLRFLFGMRMKTGSS
jgi:hypothetical protein